MNFSQIFSSPVVYPLNILRFLARPFFISINTDFEIDQAARERNVVVMTGATDFVSDGVRTFAISNGHELLGKITGSGCVLGTAISLSLAVSRDKFLAALAGLLHYEIAAEIAAAREDVRGPGTFVPALIDELYKIHKSTSQGDWKWLERAKVEAFNTST